MTKEVLAVGETSGNGNIVLSTVVENVLAPGRLRAVRVIWKEA